ncbi:prepilin-type N-terminal cleavage/methylation domain-containing protein [Candidatus Parcubacteria bacterium]|nr:prepilin-type N-terminal cleavage/methylation domain-containing protein [Candidatus Parcubacteria bacterium]
MRSRGLTLVELLVVITIIGIISTIIIGGLSQARETSKKKRVQADFKSIQDQVGVSESDVKLLKDITGSSCTDCGFSNATPMNNQPGALAANAQAWLKIGFSNPPMDPWGTPYTLDENEYEFGTTDCRPDLVVTAGPDGILSTSDDTNYSLPHVICPP